MIPNILPQEFLAISDALANGPEPDLARLNRYVAQSGIKRASPALVFQVAEEKSYAGGRIARVLITLTIESPAGDEGAEGRDSHLSSVALVHRLFVGEKAARMAEIAARGTITFDDYGKLPSRLDVAADQGGDRLRTAIILRGLCRLTALV